MTFDQSRRSGKTNGRRKVCERTTTNRQRDEEYDNDDSDFEDKEECSDDDNSNFKDKEEHSNNIDYNYVEMIQLKEHSSSPLLESGYCEVRTFKRGNDRLRVVQKKKKTIS